MATVRELSDPYANFMLNPRPPAEPGVYEVCLTFSGGFATCFARGHQPRYADAVLPISYSVHFGRFHQALRLYKRASGAMAQKFAGVEHVGVVIIGRHVHEEYGSNRERLRAIPRPFNWETRALEADY